MKKKFRAYGTMQFIIYEKKNTNPNDFDSKRSSSRCFASSSNGFCPLLAISFFPSKQFLFNFFYSCNSKRIICAPKLCNKKYRSPLLVSMLIYEKTTICLAREASRVEKSSQPPFCSCARVNKLRAKFKIKNQHEHS